MSEIQRAVRLLRQGRLVAFPTETVYGLGADASSPVAVERIYQTKGRPSTNPLIVHVASAEVARRYVTHWPDAAQQLAARFWPGPLTLVLPKNNVIPDNATAGLPTVGLRVPNHPLALELLTSFDGPLAAPSANRSTHVSPTTARHVRDEFPESAAAGGPEANDPALILDGGPCTVGIESTVLDLTTSPPTILRPGHVTPDDLRPIIGAVSVFNGAVAATSAAASPGQQEVHYAPRAPAYRFDRPHRKLILRLVGVNPPSAVALVLDDPTLHQDYPAEDDLRRDRRIVFMPNEPEGYARGLYHALRELDDRKPQSIWVELPPDAPEWAAVRDRLSRATRPAPIL